LWPPDHLDGIMADEPELTEDEAGAHAAATDATLDEILGEDAPDEYDELASSEEPVEAVEAAPAEEDQPEADTEGDYHKAWLALQRDGWNSGQLDALEKEVLVTRGLERAKAQATNDEVYRDRDRLRDLSGTTSGSEATEGQPGAGDPAQAEASDPDKAGADLTSLAGPVAEAIVEMQDPEEVAAALASFTQEAIKAAGAGGAENDLQITLALRAQRLRPDLTEGDISTLMAKAKRLAGAGEHSDKDGLDRFDALFSDAALLAGHGGESQDISTSRASRKRGSRPPMGGNRAPKKPRSEDELLDAKLARIMSGERDASTLRAMR
jgi:hypothetical protein